jgi:hypothetical protein
MKKIVPEFKSMNSTYAVLISSGKFDFAKKVYTEYILCKLFLFCIDQNSIPFTFWGEIQMVINDL